VEEGALALFSADVSEVGDGSVTWDLGDGTVAGGLAVEHRFADNGKFEVTARVIDANGDVVDDDRVKVEVTNAVPVLELASDGEWVSGQGFRLPVTELSDPGIADTLTVTVDWGDGTTDPDMPADAVSRPGVGRSHVFVEEGDYTLSVTVTDDDGDSTTGSMALQVLPATHQILGLEVEMRSWTTVGETLYGRARPSMTVAAPLTFNLDDAPDGMAIDNSGLISWTPNGAQVGDHHVKVILSDGENEATEALDITVSDAKPQASARITASVGGTIEVTDAASPALGVKLTIPAGALTEDTEITIAIAATAPTSSTTAAGPLLELRPSGIEFSEPVVLKIPYGEVSPDLPASSLTISTYLADPAMHGAKAAGWVSLPTDDVTVDEASQVVTAKLRHFSPYQINHDLWRFLWRESSYYETQHFTIFYFKTQPPSALMADEMGHLPPHTVGRGYVPSREVEYALDPDVPHYVQDLGLYLETSYVYYVNENYPVAPANEQIVVSIVDRPFGLDNADGAAMDENAMPQIQIRNILTAERLKYVAAHELFHTVEFRASHRGALQVENFFEVYLQRDGKWLMESAADSAALDVFPWPNAYPHHYYFLDENFMRELPIEFYNPYVAYPLFKGLKEKRGLDFVKNMFNKELPGVADLIQSMPKEMKASEYLYRYLLDEEPADYEQTLQEFGFAFHYLRSDTWIERVSQWFGAPRPMIEKHSPNGRERAEGDHFVEPLPRGVPGRVALAPGAVSSFGVDLTRALCDPHPDTGECRYAALTPKPEGFTLVIKPTIPDNVLGIAYKVAVDTEQEPLALSDWRRFTSADLASKDIEVPMEDIIQCSSDGIICSPTHDIVVTLLNHPTEGSFDTVQVEAYFRPNAERQLAVGKEFACALDGDGVQCWGKGNRGELGSTSGETCGEEFSPAQVAPASFLIEFGQYTCTTRLCNFQNLLVPCTFDVLGSFELFEDPDLAYTCSRSPQRVSGSFTNIAAGDRHACALDEDGHAWCWGDGASGATGPGGSRDRCAPQQNSPSVTVPCAKTPVQVSSLQFKSIAAGSEHTCAVAKETDIVYCWGKNGYSQMGFATAFVAGKRDSRPYPTPAATGVVADAVYAYANKTCVIRDGAVSCWGDNWLAQLGFTSTNECMCSHVPSPIGGADTAEVSVLWRGICVANANGDHTCTGSHASFDPGYPVARVAGNCFTTTDGATLCEGSNTSGQLGRGTWDKTGVFPLGDVNGVQEAVDIQASAGGYCTVDAQQRVQCWGANVSGQASGTGEQCYEVPNVGLSCPGPNNCGHGITAQGEAICSARAIPAAHCQTSPVSVIQ